MVRHVLRNALVLWLSGQHLNRLCKSGEASKATGKQKWPTFRNVGILYRHNQRRAQLGPGRDCLPSFEGLVQLRKHACCANLGLHAERRLPDCCAFVVHAFFMRFRPHHDASFTCNRHVLTEVRETIRNRAKWVQCCEYGFHQSCTPFSAWMHPYVLAALGCKAAL
jgi:hypothetical protein